MARSAAVPASEQPQGNPLSRDTAETLARTLRAIADPTRLQILSILSTAVSGEAGVGDIAEELGLRQPTISHHLRVMSEDGLLAREQRGRNVWYSIAADRRTSIEDLLG